MKSFQEMISKYQFMEVNTQRRATGLKEKIPDIQKTLDTVQFLRAQEVSPQHIFSFSNTTSSSSSSSSFSTPTSSSSSWPLACSC